MLPTGNTPYCFSKTALPKTFFYRPLGKDFQNTTYLSISCVIDELPPMKDVLTFGTHHIHPGQAKRFSGMVGEITKVFYQLSGFAITKRQQYALF